MNRPIAVVDIDGVVADVRHRLHHLAVRPKRWGAFFAAAVRDPALDEGLAVVRRLADDHEIVYVTGRPDHLRAATEAWLERFGIGGYRLVMRSAGDRRPAPEVKLELIASLAVDRRVGIVVDDDAAVLATVAKAGYPTFPATWGLPEAASADVLRSAQGRHGRT